jgi:alkylation response protein AidB-like acyl-CoA dehydrogenase
MTAPIVADEMQMLRDTTRAALQDAFSPPRVRELMGSLSGWDPQLWVRLCRDVGLAGVAVAERHGGSGLTYREAGMVFEEAGMRTAACLFGTRHPAAAVSGRGGHRCRVPRTDLRRDLGGHRRHDRRAG